MALQGALETFKLDEVLRLLGSSEKTGLLTLTGDRGIGRVWVERGCVTQTEIEVDTNFVEDEADAVFHMLRFLSGEFLFDDADEGASPGDASLVMGDVLDEAQARLDEWRDIVGTITGLDSQVTLVATIDTDITIDPAAWERLALVGSGVSIREMGVQLAEAELHTMRAVKELVERGLVDVDDTPAPLATDLTPIDPVDEVESVTPFISEPAAPVVSESADELDPAAPILTESTAEPAAPIFAESTAEPATPIFAEPTAEQASTMIASPASIEAPVEAYEPPTDVPESWQTAAPASAWETSAAEPAAPESWDAAEPATPASWASAEAQEWPVDDAVAPHSTALHPTEPVEPWPEPAVENPAPTGPEAWSPPTPTDDTSAAVEEWPEPIDQGAETWNGQPLDGRADPNAVVHEWDAPPPPPSTGIESLYADDDFDTYADTGAIEYGDGAFDQAAEALGWGSEVDNSPEGFWGEQVTADAVPDPTAVGTEEASEMARRLAELSPAAARAVAQAARATTPEEREAAIAAAEAEDASVDRSLLLRFLGSFDG